MLSFFKKTIEVNFIDEVSGKTIGLSKMKPEQLPDAFDKPTTLQIAGKEWQVINAEPVYSSDFIRSGKLTIHLKSIEHVHPQNVRFMIPTISNELPAIVDTRPFNGFTCELHEDDWRQIEFLPTELLPVIQEEMTAVEAILFPGDNSSTLAGFTTIHVREKPARYNLSISLAEFTEMVAAREKGTLSITGYPGFVQDGFALRSDNYMYYGTVKDGIIKELCLRQFDQADDEFYTIASRYSLVLVVWCRGQITTF